MENHTEKTQNQNIDADKRYQLFLSQKELLDTFLKNGAISKQQYDFSLNGLKTKMHIDD